MLVGGSTPHEGNIYINGAPFCTATFWGWKEAQVVCRQLGYNYTVRLMTNSFFGDVPYWYLYTIHQLDCSGEESSIWDCRTVSNWKQPCTGTNGNGIICSETPPSKIIFIIFRGR